MANPVAAHTFDFIHIYLSTRTSGAPGSGVWSNPITIFDGNANPSFVDANTFSAGALEDTDRSGILCFTDNAHALTFLADGAPTTPIVIQVGSDEFVSSDYWDMTQGAWTINGNLYAVVCKHPLSSQPVRIIKSTDGGVTWAYMDAANQPPQSNGVLVQRVDGKILLFSPDFVSVPGYSLYIFDTGGSSPDTYTKLGFFADFPVQDVGENKWSNGIFLWPNGDIGVVYDHDSSDGGLGCVYQLYHSGSFGTPVYFPGAEYAQALMDPSGTFLHVLTYDTLNDKGSIVHYSTVTQAGTVTGDITTIPATVSSGDSDGVGHSSIQNNMIFVPRDDHADFDNAVWVAALPVTAFFKELLPIPVGESGVISAAGPGGSLGSGYSVGDTGTTNGGTPGFLAGYEVQAIHNNIINAWSIGGALSLGSGYAVGDQFTIAGGSTLATAQVLAVGGGGSVSSIGLLTLGEGYSTGVTTTTATSGVGAGLQFDVVSVINGISSLRIFPAGGGYSVANNVATTPGGLQPGTGSGLQINILAVTGKTPSCAYMMFPNGYSLTPSPLTPACPIGGSTATLGVEYTKMLLAVGGTPPYTWELVG